MAIESSLVRVNRRIGLAVSSLRRKHLDGRCAILVFAIAEQHAPFIF
jgi:hypothetical protein